MPHIHLILFLDKKCAIRDAETVDKIVNAEIPDKNTHPRLYRIVKQFQVHGPCGSQNIKSPCMGPDMKVCTKHYPKLFPTETNYHSKGYPIYRRRVYIKKILFFIMSPRSLVVQSSRPAIERPGLESQRRLESGIFFSQKF